MHPDLPHIGSREIVDLPNFDIAGVPAKIDTGAYSSSIWASDIKEDNGVLSFKLFGPGSKFYTGQVITTEDYASVTVRSAFGDVEVRFATQISIRLGNKTIKSRMTLSDRSKNNYKILIGKKTISNKFIVDVSTKFIHVQEPTTFKVLVLDTDNSDTVGQFLDNVSEVSENITINYSNYNDIIAIIDDSEIRLLNAFDKRPLDHYDLIYFKTHWQRPAIAATITQYATFRNIPFMNPEVGYISANSKLTDIAVLSNNNIRTIKTISVHHSQIMNNYEFLVVEAGLPFVLEDAGPVKSKHKYLINSYEDYSRAANIAIENNLSLIAQPFIPSNGDIRCLVLGNRVSLAINRNRTTDTTTPSISPSDMNEEIIPADELTPEIKSLALNAAATLKRKVASVDIIQNTATGEWHVMSVSSSPQLASGSFQDEKIQEFSKFLTRIIFK